jgi:hypothetical protein
VARTEGLAESAGGPCLLFPDLPGWTILSLSILGLLASQAVSVLRGLSPHLTHLFSHN